MGQGQGSNLGAFPVSYVANLFHFVSPLKASYRHKIPDLSRSPPSFFLTLSQEIAQTLATAISLNAGAAYVYSLRALEAYDQFKK